jgi:hypothetical protein
VWYSGRFVSAGNCYRVGAGVKTDHLRGLQADLCGIPVGSYLRGTVTGGEQV